jgi:polyhydroxybutyrate depolymerase
MRNPKIQIGKNRLRLLWMVILLAGCAPAVTQIPGPTLPNPPTFTWPVPPTKSPGDSVRSLTVAGLERTYLLHVPTGLSSSSPAPLVLIFHGHRMSGDDMPAMTGFSTLADAGSFIVAYPNGTGSTGALSFNAGLCCGLAEKNKLDEAAFVRAILADLEALHPIDPARVYIAGFSNGAMLAYRLACEMPETIAAIAPVAGNLGFDPCQPGNAVSVIHIQGLSDKSAPYDDDDREPDLNPVIRSVKSSVGLWASIDNCSEFPYGKQNGIATHTAYSGCAGGSAVELYSLYGIGHVWPAESLWPTSQIIWEFFSKHPKT